MESHPCTTVTRDDESHRVTPSLRLAVPVMRIKTISSHQKRFTVLLPGEKMQGTSVGAEPSREFRPPRPAEPRPAPALATPRSAVFGGRLQWPDHQSSLSPQQSKATSHPPVLLPLFLGSLRPGAMKGLSVSPALTVLQNQCRGTWVGQCELAWLLLENYIYTVNKRKSSAQQLYISTKSMKG
ncbi:uncharacterized protein J5F26_005214 [Ciconia maguari]